VHGVLQYSEGVQLDKPINLEILNAINEELSKSEEDNSGTDDNSGSFCCRCGDMWAGDVNLP